MLLCRWAIFIDAIKASGKDHVNQILFSHDKWEHKIRNPLLTLTDFLLRILMFFPLLPILEIPSGLRNGIFIGL